MENTINPTMEDNGNVNISDEVIAVIASLAASEVKGVAGMCGGLGGGIVELLGKKNLSKGVKLTVNEKSVALDLSVIAEYGTKIPAVAWELQEKVKNEVEAMTGLQVTAVNISVDGVNVPKIDNEKPGAGVAAEEPVADIEVLDTDETTEE
ncbi:MAG: Asp23/Gls24 family envelope stress response protein [Clostridia bacterium]|nr:Asp23/Gls24 family envelope stress response protein [Clostridia bacterium]